MTDEQINERDAVIAAKQNGRLFVRSWKGSDGIGQLGISHGGINVKTVASATEWDWLQQRDMIYAANGEIAGPPEIPSHMAEHWAVEALD